MFKFNYLFLLIFFCFVTPALAAEKADVRFGSHEDYERLVFDWKGNVPEYELSTSEDVLEITFSSSVDVNTSAIEGADSALINEFQITAPNRISIFLNPFQNIRDVTLGKKTILDIYLDPAYVAARPAQPKEEVKDIVEEPEPEVEPQVSNENIELSGKPEMPAEPPPTVLREALKEKTEHEPHAFVLSSTDGARMAAYERFGFLWIVVNRVDLPVEPHIEGNDLEQFGPLNKYLIADNTATLWQIKLPTSINVTGEGGSLYWRIILSHNKNSSTIKPSAPKNVNVETDAIRSGQVVFPAASEKNVVAFQDPIAGDQIKVVTMDTSEVYTNRSYKFVDFKSLISPIGLAFVANNPNLTVEPKGDEVYVSADGGLVLTKPEDISKNTSKKKAKPKKEKGQQLFDFEEWAMGPTSALEENQRLLMGALRGKSKAGQAERFLTLAKLNLAHGRGAEARGYIEKARDLMPQLSKSPTFTALRGVASHMTWQHDLALPDLFHKALKDYPEINIWKSASLAHLGDWQQAIELLPSDLSSLRSYPMNVAAPLILTLSEVALRNGDIETAEMLLSDMEESKDSLSMSHKNGMKYLKGEILRQKGETEEAITIWTRLSNEEDPLYRTKAELSLVALGRDTETVTPAEAVDRLENLRFVWRGDDLEIQVLRELGLSEIEAKRYVDGFKTLRDTVVLSANNQINDTVTNLMIQTYEDIFLTDQLETISPLDAAMLYEEFRELTPSGEKGDRLVARLAERLVDADLLGRAVKLLAHQLDFRLKGEDAVNTALRMASIQLMDRRAEDALSTLGKAEILLQRSDFPSKGIKGADLELLKARALADSEDVGGALELLQNMTPATQDTYRLEADIAWRVGRWNDAASALRQLVLLSEFDTESDFTEEEAELLLNYAISLNLSDQRATLRNLRERHLDQMQISNKGELFEVITRPRQNALLADRETILGMIGETEIFSDFLDTYKTQ